MTVAELIELLREHPDDATVAVESEAGACRDTDLALTSDGHQVVLRTDAAYYAMTGLPAR